MPAERGVEAARAEPSARAAHGRAPQNRPDVARGPAVAGTDPARGITDVESQPDVDRANPT